MKKILVTGGLGFIGSNFIRHMLKCYPYQLINLDKMTYAGNMENLEDIAKDPRYTFVKGDIRDKALVEYLFDTYNIEVVINFAAESHVDRSIEEPELFLLTNVLGTQNLLEVAKKHWKLEPQDKYSRNFKQGIKFIQISTDEVYGSLGEVGSFTEKTSLAPNSPYSASKASADLLVRAYFETFGMPTNITRCSNNYGSYQFPEKLIPLMIHNCLLGKELPIYGDGLQIRDWLHVEDHCRAIDVVLHRGTSGEVYNVGGNNEKTNLELVESIIETIGQSKSLIKHIKDRPGHDRRYAIDSSKIMTQLGWKPRYSFEEGIGETIEWYITHQDWMNHILLGEYEGYYERMYLEVNEGSC